MTDTSLAEFAYPTPAQARDQVLRIWKAGYASIGVDLNVRVNSAAYKRADAFASRISVAINNGQLTWRDVSPLRARGAALDTLIDIFGVEVPAASKAQGYVIIGVQGAATAGNIPANYLITFPSGVVAQTLTLTTAPANLATVLVEALEAGADTDVAEDTVGQWNASIVANLVQTATLAPGGLDGGASELTEEEKRQLLLDRLGLPAVGGNWSFVVQEAKKASAAAKFVAVYQAVQGPSSVDVAIMGADDDPVLNAATVAVVEAAVAAEMPGGAVRINATAVAAEYVDVVLDLELPLPSTNGASGNGWVDPAPYPSTADSAYARITAVSATTNTITVDSTSADLPVAGKTIAIWDYTSINADESVGTMKSFTIATVGGSTGAYTLQLGLNQDLSWVEVGMYVSAASIHQQSYGEIIRDQVRSLGPGEKTANEDLLRYAARKPAPNIDRHFKLTSRALCPMTNRGEVIGAAYALRRASGTTTALTAPTVSTTTAQAPNKLMPKFLAFRRVV